MVWARKAVQRKGCEEGCEPRAKNRQFECDRNECGPTVNRPAADVDGVTDRVRVPLHEVRANPADNPANQNQPAEITTFRDRVVAKVAQMMDLEVTAQALKAQQAGDTSIATAYASYLEGRGYLQRRDRPENLDKAITAFKEAIAKDDKYALAYAGAADAYFRKYDSGKDPIAIKEADAN